MADLDQQQKALTELSSLAAKQQVEPAITAQILVLTELMTCLNKAQVLSSEQISTMLDRLDQLASVQAKISPITSAWVSDAALTLRHAFSGTDQKKN